MLLQELQASLVHLLNQRLGSLLAVLLIKGFLFIYPEEGRGGGRGGKRERRRRMKGKDAICVFLARWFVFSGLGLIEIQVQPLKIVLVLLFSLFDGLEKQHKQKPHLSQAENIYLHTLDKVPFLSSLFKSFNIIVCHFKREGLHHCHQ